MTPVKPLIFRVKFKGFCFGSSHGRPRNLASLEGILTGIAEEKSPNSSIWRWPKADERRRMRLSNYTLTPTRINNAKAKVKLYKLLIRPGEVSSRIAHATVLEVADDTLGALLKHRHMFIGGVA